MNALEIAKKMETDAIQFYTEAANKTGYPAGRKMLLSITDDEKRHLEMIIQTIKGMNFAVSDITPMKRVKTVFEELKDEMMKKVAASKDDLDAFKIAMQMEKEGVAFYTRCLGEVKTDKEEQHYAMFASTYEFMSDTGNWFMWDERGIVEG